MLLLFFLTSKILVFVGVLSFCLSILFGGITNFSIEVAISDAYFQVYVQIQWQAGDKRLVSTDILAQQSSYTPFVIDLHPL